ncbi:MAG: TonB-dependent receptor [Pseudomonadota bacterium]
MGVSRTGFKLSLSGAAMAVALSSAPALAQAEGDAPAVDQGGLGTIVVTAQRREENVQDIPIAISSFSPDELQSRGIGNTLALGEFVPNLIAQNNTGLGASNAYFLRGIGNTESIATFDPPIGTYIDQVYLARQNGNNLSLFDVERVEVLRGPQGTLFGRNTTGGAISIVLREPGDEFDGYAEIGYGRFDRIMVRGSMDIPVGDTVAFKVSGYYNDDDGYVRNVTTGDRLNDSDGWGARIAMRLSTDIAEWNIAYARINNDGENILNFPCRSIDPATPANCSTRFATTGSTETSTGPFPGISGRKANYGLGSRSDMDLITSNLELELGDEISVSFITGYQNLVQQFNLDFFDGRFGPNPANPFPAVIASPLGGFNIFNDQENTQITQEVRFNGSLADGLIDFVAGGYYFYEDTSTDFADTFGAVGFPLLLADRVIDNDAEAFALYAQADVHITDQFTLTAGLRWTDEEKNFLIRDNRPICNGDQAAPGCLSNFNLVATNGAIIPDEQSVSIFTPRFALNYEPNDDLLFFISATRGFKSGGWNARGTAGSELLPFGPETTWSYEAGVRSEFWDNRARLNVTAYYADTTGLQTPSAFVRPAGTIAFITRNFADYENYGIEAELTLAPIDGLNIFASLGWQDDEYKIDRNADPLDEFGVSSVAAQQATCQTALAMNMASPACGAGIVTLDGRIAEPVRTPDWSIAGGVSYEVPLGDNWTVTPSVNAAFRSSFETGTSEVSVFQSAPGVFNTTGNGEFVIGSFNDGYFVVNAGITLAEVDEGLQLSVSCSNCFSEDYNSSTLANTTYYNAPGTWLVSARYDF